MESKLWTPDILAFILAGILCGSCSSGNVNPEPGSVTVKKCSDFNITGNGNSSEWSNTGWIEVGTQGSNISPYGTKVKVLYSDTGLYFLFDCQDTRLTNTMTADNLNLWEEDVVEVFIWPDESFPVYFEYELSPLDYELPIIIPNKNGKFLGWLPWNYYGDKRTRHATSVTGGSKAGGSTVTGWTAEFFIPYRLLSPLVEGAPESGDKWRANMYRIDYDDGTAYFAWQKTAGSFHEFNRFGTFVFE